MKVLGVQQRSNGSVVRVQDGDDPAPIVEAWTPADLATVQSWKGTVPAEYELRDGKKGPVLVEKRRTGGGGGYRQTKEAFEAEAASRRAWQLEEEDRKDRRTALMTAQEMAQMPGVQSEVMPWPQSVLVVAQQFYDWLRNPSDAAPSSRAQGTASDRSGEGKATAVPDAVTPSPEHHHPADPATCDHKRASGAPAKFTDAEKVERCQKCGLPWIVVIEGTLADLGPPA